MTVSTAHSERPIVAFLGGGNMAAALINGLLASGWPAQRIRVAERIAERRDWLRNELGVTTNDDARTAIHDAAATVLAVKPQQMAAALHGLRFAPGSLVLSIAAGIRLDSLRGWLGNDVALVRTMPNTPALAGAGATALYASPETPQALRKLAQRLVDSIGVSCWVEHEEQLDAVTALSGSGPAYFFLLTEAMAAAGVALGLPPATAAALARQTLIGAGRLVEQDEADIAALRERVTSKGGTTAAALQALENGDFHAIIHTAMAAAEKRSRELGATPSSSTPSGHDHAV